LFLAKYRDTKKRTEALHPVLQQVTDREPNKLHFGTVAKVSHATVKTNIRHKKLLCSCVLVALAFVTFGLAVFEQQLLWDNENKVSSACNKVKCLISILSVFMAAVIICRKELVLHEQKHCGLVIKDASLWNCHLSRDLLFEVIFNLLCSPPYVAYEVTYALTGEDAEVNAYYTIDALATIVIAVRIYHCFPLLFHLLEKDHANKNPAELGALFTVKAVLRTNPILFLAAVSCSTCAFFAYATWIFERAYCATWTQQLLEPEPDPELLERCSGSLVSSGGPADAYWAMLNTMDNAMSNAPLTPWGRLVKSMAMAAGLAVVALLVHAVAQLMAFTPFEKRAFEATIKQNHRAGGYSKAALLIEATWLRYVALKNGHKKELITAYFSVAFYSFRKHRKDGGRTVLLPTEHDVLAQTLAMIVDSRIYDLKAHIEMRQTAAMVELRESIAELTKAVIQQQAPQQAQQQEEPTTSSCAAGHSGNAGKGGAADTSAAKPSAPNAQAAEAAARRGKPDEPIASPAASKGAAANPTPPVMSPLAGMTNVTKEEKELARKMLTSDSDEEGSVDSDDEDEKSTEKSTYKKSTSFRSIVMEIYKEHNPEKLGSVDSLMDKYAGNENQLIQKLATKYKFKVPAGAPGHWMS
jgi:hypothetical protein